MGALTALAWEGIVDDTPLQNPNSLTHNRVYSRIGHNVCLAAKPAVVHFGGLQLGAVHKQTLKVYNTSSKSTRMHVIVPTTPYFKATCEQKKGLLAPGMCEVIQVEFCPKEWRYYYDCIRIHCEDENLLVPVHAYPVMNETRFPSRVDFGKCALGEVSCQRISMECKVPINFEFEIVPVKANPLFNVFPSAGVVPANGSVEITVEFCPSRLATEVLELEVRLAEFNSSPVRCTVSGSGFPGVARQRAFQALTGLENPSVEELEGTKPLGAHSFAATTGAGGGDGKGGSGGGDAFTRMLAEKRMNHSLTQSLKEGKRTSPMKVRLPKPRPKTPERKIEGVYVPADVVTPSDVTYVLNQEPNKLRMRDVKGAIAQRKAQLEAAKRSLGATLKASRPPGLDPLDDMALEHAVKADLFTRQLNHLEEHKRRMSMTSAAVVGSDLPPPEDVAAAQSARRDSLAEHAKRMQLQDAQRLEPELTPGGARFIPAGSDQMAAELAAFKPSWDLNKRDIWLKRQQVLYRFVQAARRVVYQVRAKRRLQQINAFLDNLGRDRHRIAAEVMAGTSRPAGPLQGRPTTAGAALYDPALVRLHPLPVYREAAFNSYQAVKPTGIADYDDMTPMDLQVPLQYQVLGYQPEEFPAYTPYMAPLPDQPLLTGAQEEEVGPRAQGPPVEDISEFGSMPQELLHRPFDTLPIGSRYTDEGVFTPLKPSWGMDKSAAIQPRILPHPDSTTSELPGTNSLKALAGLPLLSDLYTPARHTFMIGGPVHAPPLMTGPDPGDLMEADPSQPPLPVEVPTPETLERIFPGAYQQRVDGYNKSVRLKSKHALRD
ncbi:hypothetical protein WJX72_001932 [[Myrmecia] bisecta]|uniref:Primary ciliary dyskinesia protein 1 n=1 Tax=[Myrmecia] bisecta TaxID=41462 RepID=A0AAW1P5Q6_9CHLO